METFFKDNIWLLFFSLIWVLPWKGYALWIAAQNRSNRWFIVLLLLNTFAILDIIFIFYVAKKTTKEVGEALRSKF